MLIEFKGLDLRLLDESVIACMDAVRRSEGRPRVGYQDDLVPCWEVEVESALDQALRTSGLPGLNDEARINFDFGRWRLTRAQRVVVIVRLWTELNWTYPRRLNLLQLIRATLSPFLPHDWCVEIVSESSGTNAYLHARAGDYCGESVTPEADHE